MLLRVWLSVVLLALPLLAAAQTLSHTLVTTDGQVRLSYTLRDRNGAFVSSLIDHARAGDTVRVRHTVTLNPVKGWSLWGGALGSAEARYYVAYSLFDDRLSVGTTPESKQTIKSPQELADTVLTVSALPLVDAARLRTGDEYVVTITAVIETTDTGGGWVSYLPLKHLFRKQLDATFYYIAR